MQGLLQLQRHSMGAGEFGSLRDCFGAALDRLKVDCYTIYAEDAWHPFTYTPHDIDPHVYYPEVITAGPLYDIFATIRQTFEKKTKTTNYLEVTTDSRRKLNAIWYKDCSHVTSSPSSRRAELQTTHTRLFQNFHKRESIRSAVVVSPFNPRCDHAFKKPEILFLNFRTQTDFERDERKKLLQLADDMLYAAAGQYKERRRAWLPALSRIVAAQSSLVSSILRDATPGVYQPQSQSHIFKTDRAFYGTMIDSIIAATPLTRRNGWRASLSLMQEDNKTLRICTGAAHNFTSAPKDLILIKKGKPCTSELNITANCVLTRQSIFLNYVDPPGHINIPISSRQFAMLKKEHRPEGIELRESKRAQRLLIQDHLPDALQWLRDQSAFGKSHPILLSKLETLIASSFSSLCISTGDGWERPFSVLCVPIILCGQAIGCINIEARDPDTWNPSVTNLIAFLSGICGIAISARMRLQLLIAVNELAAVQKELLPDRLRRFARAVRDALWCKHVEFSVEAATPSGGEMVSYSKLVSSSDDVSGKIGQPLRASGWTDFVAKKVSALGVVLLINKPVELESADDVYELQAHRAWYIQQGKGSEIVCAEFTEDLKSNTDNYPKISLNKKDHLDCLWLISIRIPVQDVQAAMRGSQQVKQADAILWIHHREFGTCDFGRGEAVDASRLADYCSHAISIAGVCAIVPAIWEAEIASYAQVSAIMKHGGYSQPIGSLAFALEDAYGETRNAKYRVAADLAEYLEHKTHVFDKMQASLWKAEKLRTQASAMTDLSNFVKLRELVDQSWRIATVLEEHSESTEALIYFENKVDFDDPAPHHIFLREILVQVFRNVRVHAVEFGKALNIEVACSHTADELIITITNDGKKLNIKNIPRNLTLGEHLERIRKGHNIGSHTIYVLAQAIGASAKVLPNKPKGALVKIQIRHSR